MPEINTIQRTSIFLDSPNFTNSPRGEMIFEPQQGKEYHVRTPFLFSKGRREFVQVQPGDRVVLRKVDGAVAYFEVISGQTRPLTA